MSARIANGLDQRIRFASALAIIDGDSGAGLSQRPDDRGSNTASASGHQRDAAMQSTCRHWRLQLATF
jgi:hypothetical protein